MVLSLDLSMLVMTRPIPTNTFSRTIPRMQTRRRPASSRKGGIQDHVWNIVGGAMVSAMIAGVIYVLVGSMAQFLNNNESYWDLNYLKWYFAAVLIVYMLMPTMLANIVGVVFGSKSSASGTKNND